MEKKPECLKLKNRDFVTCISNVEHNMRKFWVPTIFHNYTDHGYDHSQRIITYIEALLDGNPNLLNPKERFILLASIYLHDVGMQSPFHAGRARLADSTRSRAFSGAPIWSGNRMTIWIGL